MAAGVAENDLSGMQQAVTGGGGASALLGWLSRRLGVPVGLVDGSGMPVQWHPARARLPDGLSSGFLRSGPSCGAGSVEGAGWRASVVNAGGHAVVVLGEKTGIGPREMELIRRAADLLRLRLAGEAEVRARETVLRLLLQGEPGPARMLAAAVSQGLPDVVCVAIAEGPAGERPAAMLACEPACRPAMVIPSPVSSRHLIVLAPGGSGTAMADALRRAWPGAAAGAGAPVALGDVATGYEQASHAVALARRAVAAPPDRQSVTPPGDLAGILGPDGRQWAQALLKPLTAGYRPARYQDPDTPELLDTLAAWLHLGVTSAARALHVHRNTLTGRNGRIRRIESLLGTDLSRLEAQAELSLALRLLTAPADGGTAADLDLLLSREPARAWAAGLLGPLSAGQDATLLPAVRAWLASGAQVTGAAMALGVRPDTARRRLTRAEALLRRPLVSGSPSAKFDVHLALRALEA